MTKTNGKDVSPSGLRMSYFIQQNRSYIVTCAAVMVRIQRYSTIIDLIFKFSVISSL